MRFVQIVLGLAILGVVGGLAVAQPMSYPTGPMGNSGTSSQDLVDLIGSTVQPGSWDTVGGPGSMAPFDPNLSLVVSQTQEVHEEIVDLLEQLRRLQDLQVTVEVPFRTVSDSFFESMGVGSWSGHIKGIPFSIGGDLATPQFGGYDPSAGMRTGVAFGNPAYGTPQATPDTSGGRSTTMGMDAAGQFFPPRNGYGLRFPNIHASQGYRQTAVTQSPKVTLFNGQRAYVSDTSQSPFVISVIPVVGGCPLLPIPPVAYVPIQKPVLAVTNPRNHRVEAMRRKLAEQQQAKMKPGEDEYFRYVEDPTRPRRIPVKAEEAPQREQAGDLNLAGPPRTTASAMPGRRLASAQESSAGRAVPSVAEARRMHEAEQTKGDNEARVLYERGQAAEDDHNPGVARIYYGMALRRATGQLRDEILARLKGLPPRETRE